MNRPIVAGGLAKLEEALHTEGETRDELLKRALQHLKDGGVEMEVIW